MKTNKKIEIYSTPTCHYCILVKDFLKSKDIPFIEYNVATDLDKRREMVEISDQGGVPVVKIEDEIMIGFQEDQMKEILGIE